MTKIGLVVLIIILVVAAVAATGGYYLYINNFTEHPVSVVTAIPGGPKETYIEYLSKINNVATLEDFYKTIVEYGYFDTQEQKNEAITTSTADFQKMTNTQKIKELKSLKSIFQRELSVAPQLIENVKSIDAVLTSPIDSGLELTVNMVSVQGEWKVK
jgi:hypothetical protein